MNLMQHVTETLKPYCRRSAGVSPAGPEASRRRPSKSRKLWPIASGNCETTRDRRRDARRARRRDASAPSSQFVDAHRMHHVMYYPCITRGPDMRTTINLDEQLIEQAQRMTGTQERTALIHEGLRALIARESARRLARLGGSDPRAKAPRRRRPS